jgi:hypothetical protein
MIITDDMIDDFKTLFRDLKLDDSKVKRGLGVVFGNGGLFDASEQMADGGDTPMTAAEEVLAWLLIEKNGVPDDVGYSPQQAQDIIAEHLTRKPELELTDEHVERALEKWYSSNPNWASEMPLWVADKIRSEMRATLSSVARGREVDNSKAIQQKVMQLPWIKTHHGKFWRAEVGGNVYEVFDDELADETKRSCQRDFERKVSECLTADAYTQHDPMTAPVSATADPQQVIPKHVRDFLGKMQGVCMGVALSGSAHPNPDRVLLELFHEAQAILFPQSKD